jgi:hypothetical protein
LHKDIINEELAMRCGRRKTISVSDTHAVEGDADGLQRMRALKFSMFPKLTPVTEMIALPDDTLQTREFSELVGFLWTAFEDCDVMALNATLNKIKVDFPIIDDRRHVMLESLVQIDPAQAVTENRTPGEDAMFANAWPERDVCALPVVGTCDTDKS